jgi:hypothetical protein
MDYKLHRSPAGVHTCERQRQAIVPPRPGKGQRKPRPYSVADLNALWATAHSQDWQAMVTLNPPPTNRVKTWPALRDSLIALKTTLANWHRRKGFPAMVAVTEFDPDGTDGGHCANFHIGFAVPLSEEQQKTFTDWWLGRCTVPDNRGRAFQHDANGGGVKLQDYLAKDITRRDRAHRHVKFAAPWLPERTDMRLWFVIGAKRKPAREGAKLCSQRKLRRRPFDSEHGKIEKVRLTVSTGTSDSEHAPTPITTEAHPLGPIESAVSPSFQAIQSSPRQECQICRRCWGRSLWEGSCKCRPAFPNC